ncbi:MAG: DUF2007 domain-containing protein [Candidatus Marinimicrobia bacterium]|nr:DUF2007 domain-containing protein [Candidatus Neomarinimicrobiota bacterium]
MYCPLCQAEYKPEIKHCADCNVTLVETLPPELPLEEIKWVLVGTLQGKTYAEMITEILDQEHIAHFIKSDVLTATFNISGLGSTGGRVKLYVPENKLAIAREILTGLID